MMLLEVRTDQLLVMPGIEKAMHFRDRTPQIARNAQSRKGDARQLRARERGAYLPWLTDELKVGRE